MELRDYWFRYLVTIAPRLRVSCGPFQNVFRASTELLRTFLKRFQKVSELFSELLEHIAVFLERFNVFQNVSERFWIFLFLNSRRTTRNCETRFLVVFPIVAHNLPVV